MPKVLAFKKGEARPFEIRMAKDSKEADIVIYDQIGADWFGDGITAKSFDAELKKLDASVSNLNVRINSPGGSVFDGITIYNRLIQHKAKKKVYIDGLAASIASIIALAGDEVHMGEGAMYMIHLPWTWAMGDRKELESVSQQLLDIEEQMISIYSRRSKLSRSEVKMMMEKETWMGAEEAKDKGFATHISEETVAIAASVLDKSVWLKKTPKNVVTDQTVARQELIALKTKIEEYTARKKSAAASVKKS